MYAARNLRLCTKDCVCLFVCPTGATDTEDGQIDASKCVEGCRACVDACPSHAIHLVMQRYPEPVARSASLTESALALGTRKLAQERAAGSIANGDAQPGAARLARALARSCRILAEDCAREAGYMTPQCHATRALLAEVAQQAGGDSASVAEKLIGSL